MPSWQLISPLLKSSVAIAALIFAPLIYGTENLLSKPEKVVLSEDPWPPYIIGVEGRAPTGGIAIEILQRVFDNLGVNLEMNLYPWTRSLRLVKQGQEDGHILLVSSKAWDEYMRYSIPFIDDRFLLWTRKSDGPRVEWQSFAELKPYTIAITNNYSYGSDFEQAIAEHGLKILGSESDELNFKLLLGRRFDAFVCLESVAMALFKTNPQFKGKFVAASKPIAQLALTMSFAKNSPAVKLLPQINQQLEAMKASGEIEQIINKYK